MFTHTGGMYTHECVRVVGSDRVDDISIKLKHQQEKRKEKNACEQDGERKKFVIRSPHLIRKGNEQHKEKKTEKNRERKKSRCINAAGQIPKEHVFVFIVFFE